MNHRRPDNRVITHDAYRADQRPVAVVYEGERFDVVEIDDSWIATGVETSSPVRRGFDVRCRGGARFKLVHTDGEGWSVELVPGPRLVTGARD
jgi:hypothetical protein